MFEILEPERQLCGSFGIWLSCQSFEMEANIHRLRNLLQKTLMRYREKRLDSFQLLKSLRHLLLVENKLN